MKAENGELISEIYEQGHPANYGNSMAESSRYMHLCIWLFYNRDADFVYPLTGLPISLAPFRTPETYIQSASPNCPKDWLVSTDQCLPYYLATLRTEMATRIKSWGWRTPDHNLIMPVFYACLTKNMFLVNLCILAQALIFKLPWRWDDGQHRFTSTSRSSADYLNWFHCALYCKPWIRRIVSKEVLKAKIASYYEVEPNSTWLVNLYNKVIDNNY